MDMIKTFLIVFALVAFIAWSNNIGASAKNAQTCDSYTGHNTWMIYLCHNG